MGLLYKAVLGFVCVFHLFACGKGGYRPNDQFVEVQSPDQLLWKENSTFSHSLLASATSDLRYELLSSADRDAFTLDRISGELISSIRPSFEAPEDANNDGVYEVRVLITDTDGHGEVQDISVTVEDVYELEQRVLFPAPGSNLGGVTNKIHLRGRVYGDEVTADNKETLRVTVNGVQASWVEDTASDWLIEVDVSPGENVFNLEFHHQGSLQESTTLEVDNSLIAPMRNVVSAGEDLLLLSWGATALMKTTPAEVEPELVLSADVFREGECEQFALGKFSPSGERILVACIEDGENIENFVLNLVDTTVKPLPFASELDYLHWYDESQVVLFQGPSLLVFDTLSEATVAYSIDWSDETIEQDSSRDVQMMSNVLFASVWAMNPDTGSREQYFATLDLAQASVFDETGDLTVTPQLTDFEVESYAFAVLADHFVFTDDNDFSIVVRSDDTRTTLSDVLTGNELWVAMASHRKSLVHHGIDYFVFRDELTASLFHFDFRTDTLRLVFEPGYVTSEQTELTLSPDNTQALIYDKRRAVAQTVSLHDGQVQEFHDFSDVVDVNQDDYFRYGDIAFDWEQRVLYKSNIFGWGGVAPSDVDHVVALELDEHRWTGVLSGFDLEGEVRFGDYFRVGDLSINTSTGELVTSVLSQVVDTVSEFGTTDSATALLAYNPESSALRTLNVRWHDLVQGQVDEPFLSPYSSELGVFSLTAWFDGYLELFRPDAGESITLLRGENEAGYVSDTGQRPYRITLASDIDANNRRVFVSGFYGDPEVSYSYDPDTLEVSVVSLDNRFEKEVIASAEHGAGLPLFWPQFEYNEDFDLLMDVLYDHIYMVDPVTGDRAVLPISTP